MDSTLTETPNVLPIQVIQEKSRRIAYREVYNGKWLKMSSVDYEVRGKVISNYEMMERTTRRADTGYDAIVVYPIKTESESVSSKKQLIVIANYRPPVDRFMLELPAGLMDTPDPMDNALRELKEETGYIAETTPLSIRQTNAENAVVFNDASTSFSCSKSVFLQIDGSKEVNKNPIQHLEETEEITVHHLPLDQNLPDALIDLADKHNYGISAGLWSFAQGVAFAKRYIN